MLDQLPIELLQGIYPLLDDADLCKTSALCHSLHTYSLSVLFTRHNTFNPTPTPLRTESGSSVKFPHHNLSSSYPTQCISLITSDKLNVLFGLRLALPYIFEGRQPKVLTCTFRERFSTELQHLGRLLSESPVASAIEEIVLDFSFIDQPNQQETKNLHQFLRLFGASYDGSTNAVNGAGGVKTKARVRPISFSLLNGNFGVRDDKPFELVRTSWLKSGRQTSNVVQTFTDIASRKVSSLLHSPEPGTSLFLAPPSASSSSSPPGSSASAAISPPPTRKGLEALHIHSAFPFHHLFYDWTLSLYAQHSHTLRFLSFHNTKLLEIEWPTILNRISLPKLEDLSLGQSTLSLQSITSFLVRHRTIKRLDLGNSIRENAHSSIAGGHAASWKRPPYFLPGLVSLKGSLPVLAAFLSPKFGSSVGKDTLSELAFVVIVEGVRPRWPTGCCALVDPYRTRLEAFKSVALEVHVESESAEWMNAEQEDVREEGRLIDVKDDMVKAFKEVRKVVIYIWITTPGYLEREQVKGNLAKWLSRFERLESVEVWGCEKENEKNKESRKELIEQIREKKEKLKSLLIEGDSVI